MKNAIILHGMPSKEEYYNSSGLNQSDSHWISWLQRQLMLNDIYAATPEMPLSFKPDYKIWKREFERYDITPESTLVGHSCGGGFLIRWLSENKDVKVNKVILVAPWINTSHEVDIDFFDFVIDPKIIDRAGSIIIFNSSNDDEVILDSVKTITNQVPGIGYKEFKGYGHFCYRDMRTQEFPELLDEIIGVR